MKYVIDSNIFIYAAAGLSEALNILDNVDAGKWVGFSAITRLEVLGFRKFAENEELKLRALLACFDEYDVTSKVIDQAIELRRNISIKVPDAIVAATSLVNGAVLVTRNTSDFDTINGLNVINPFDEKLG